MLTTLAFCAITFRIFDEDDDNDIINETGRWGLIALVLLIFHVLTMFVTLDQPFTTNIFLTITYIISVVPICLTICELVVFLFDIKFKYRNRYINVCTQGMIIRSLICLLFISIFFVFFNYIIPSMANRACQLHDSWRFLEVIAKINNELCHPKPHILSIWMISLYVALVSVLVPSVITGIHIIVQYEYEQPHIYISFIMCLVIGFMFYGFFIEHYIIGILWSISTPLLSLIYRVIFYLICGSVEDTKIGMDKKCDNV
jgi:hypothetical protein